MLCDIVESERKLYHGTYSERFADETVGWLLALIVCRRYMVDERPLQLVVSLSSNNGTR